MNTDLDREEGPGAAGSRPQADRRAQGHAAARLAHRRTRSRRRSRAAVPLWRRAGREGLIEADRRASARAACRCPIATTTSRTTSASQEIRRQYRRARDEDVHPGRRHARAGRQRSRGGDGDRNRAGQGLHQPHRPARPGESLPHLHRRRTFRSSPPTSTSRSTSKTSRCAPSTPSMWPRPTSSRA